MGKGDKKSKRGKIAIGSYGNTRKRKRRAVVSKAQSGQPAPAEEEVAKPKKTARKKAEA